jgi:excisionase family DNA binding protein
MTPEERLLGALDDLRDALGAVLAARARPPEPPALLTITAAAARLGVSRSTVTRWADAGRLRTIGGPNARRVPLREVERLAS